MSRETYYTALGVLETASSSEIRTAYRNLLKKIHPDTVCTLSPALQRMAADATKEIIEAYSVLSDDNKRRRYDQQMEWYAQPSVALGATHTAARDERSRSRDPQSFHSSAAWSSARH